MGWRTVKRHSGDFFVSPKIPHVITEGVLFPFRPDFDDNNMLFSDSYDWAYLLLKKCFHLGKSKEAYARIAYNGMMEAGFSGRSEPPQPEIATPAQITFACIEVLEGLC